MDIMNKNSIEELIIFSEFMDSFYKDIKNAEIKNKVDFLYSDFFKNKKQLITKYKAPQYYIICNIVL